MKTKNQLTTCRLGWTVLRLQDQTLCIRMYVSQILHTFVAQPTAHAPQLMRHVHLGFWTSPLSSMDACTRYPVRFTGVPLVAIPTSRSATPFDAGEYGTDEFMQIPF